MADKAHTTAVSRRNLCAGMATIMATGAPVSALSAQDPHLDWWRDYQTVQARIEEFCATQPIELDYPDEWFDEKLDLLKQSISTPASGLQGVLCQLRSIRERHLIDIGGLECMHNSAPEDRLINDGLDTAIVALEGLT